MNTKTRFPLLLLLIFATLILAGCGGYSPVRGSVVVGDTFTLRSDQTLNDDLTIMGGVANLEEGSTVNGDVSVLGGTLEVEGTIDGDLSVMGGAVNLNDGAEVTGDVSQIGGSVNKSDGATVGGSFDYNRPPRVSLPRGPRMDLPFDPFAPLAAFFNSLMISAMAVLVSLFALGPMSRVGKTVQTQPIISGGIGLLTLIVTPALLLILLITIILSPISLLGGLLLVLAFFFGWISLGLLTGQQIARWLNQSWSEPINAGVGTLALTLIASLFNAIPCIGWLANFVIAILGLGAVVVTRFGMQTYSGGSVGGFGGYSTAPRYPAQPAAPAAQPYPQQQPYQPQQQQPYYPETRYEGPEGVARNTIIGPDPSTLDPDYQAPAASSDDELQPPKGLNDEGNKPFTPEI